MSLEPVPAPQAIYGGQKSETRRRRNRARATPSAAGSLLYRSTKIISRPILPIIASRASVYAFSPRIRTSGRGWLAPLCAERRGGRSGRRSGHFGHPRRGTGVLEVKSGSGATRTPRAGVKGLRMSVVGPDVVVVEKLRAGGPSEGLKAISTAGALDPLAANTQPILVRPWRPGGPTQR